MESLWHWWEVLHKTHSAYCPHWCQKSKENSPCHCWFFFPLETQNWWSSCGPGLCQHSAVQCAEEFCKAVASLPVLQISDLFHPSCCLFFLNQNQWKQKRALNTTSRTHGASHCIVLTGWRERKVLALKETQAADLVEPQRQCWIFPSYCDRDCKVKWDTGIRSSVGLYIPLSSLRCVKSSQNILSFALIID